MEASAVMTKLHILEVVGALLVVASAISAPFGATISIPLGIASAVIGLLVVLLR